MKPGQCRRTEGCAGERTALVNDGPLVGPPIRERNAVQLLSLHLCLPAGNADWLFRPSAVRAADGHGFSASPLAVFLWLGGPRRVRAALSLHRGQLRNPRRDHPQPRGAACAPFLARSSRGESVPPPFG